MDNSLLKKRIDDLESLLQKQDMQMQQIKRDIAKIEEVTGKNIKEVGEDIQQLFEKVEQLESVAENSG